MATTTDIRRKVKKIKTEQQQLQRIINQPPSPTYPIVTQILDREFSAHTKFMAEKYPLLVSHMEEKVDFRAQKIVFLGGMSVGKTSIIRQYSYELFTNNYTCSLGLNFEVEQFRILNCVHSLQLWDTAGQERYQSISLPFYRNASVIVAVFDLTVPKTLETALEYVDKAISVASPDIKQPVFLVGCKLDLVHNSQYRLIHGNAKKCALQIGAEYTEVSCKSKHGITHLFQRIASASFQNYVSDISPTQDSAKTAWEQFIIRLTPNKEDDGKQPKCCVN